MAERSNGQQNKTELYSRILFVLEKYQADLLEREYLQKSPNSERSLVDHLVVSAEKSPTVAAVLNEVGEGTKKDFLKRTYTLSQFHGRMLGLLGLEGYSQAIPEIQANLENFIYPRGSNGLPPEDAMLLVHSLEIGQRILNSFNASLKLAVENSSTKE